MSDEIYEYHKGRKSIDHDFIRKIWLKDWNEYLARKLKEDPHKKYLWPPKLLEDESYHLMGYIPNEEKV